MAAKASKSGSVGTSGPPTDIEITPAMIEAGSDRVWALRGFDPNYVAEEVFLAMWAKHAAELPAPAKSR